MQLPDFQRSFVWNEGSKRQLIDSIQKAYPVGALLFLEIDPLSENGSPFGKKPFNGVVPGDATQPLRWLVLDGQQRLTTVFNTFSQAAAPQPAARPKWFFLDIKSLFDWTHDPNNRDKKPDFAEHIQNRVKTAQPDGLLFTNNLLGLPYIAEGRDALRQRLENYAQNCVADSPEYANWIRVSMQSYFDAILDYKFPCVVLPSSLDLEAVSNVFTILNVAGVKLTAFDLCVSKFFPHGVALREWWNAARASTAINYLDKDGTSLLQSIALLSGKSPRKSALVRNLETIDLNQNWQRVVDGFETVASHLSTFGVTSRKSLPYDTVVPAIAAANLSAAAPNGPVEMASRKAKIQRWVMQTGFNQRYTEGSDAKKELDFQAALPWFNGESTPDFLTNNPVVWPENMPHISNSGARYKALTSMLNASNPKDFVDPLNSLGLDNQNTQAEIHHVFPKAFLRRRGLEPRAAERAFNMTFLSGDSNRLISDDPPSVYLNNLIDSWSTDVYRGVPREELLNRLEQVMATHFIDSAALAAMWSDNYEAFLIARADTVRAKLESLDVSVQILAQEDEEIEHEELFPEDDDSE